jgi:hypothetical protein
MEERVMKCPECSKENPAGSRFCQFCGAAFSPAGAAEGTLTPTSLTPAKEIPAPATQPSPQAARIPQTRSAVPIDQLGTGGTSAASIWGPFAGYGTRGAHVSWLLDDLGHRAETLHEAVTERFQHRQIPGSDMDWKPLYAKGLLVERRPFYFIRRGITTVALYIAQFGQDLYISQVTYLKGPVSPVRVLMVALMLLFFLYFNFIYPDVLANRMNALLNSLGNLFGSRSTSSFPTFLLCVIGPMGVANQFLLAGIVIYSIYKWLRERDVLAILRARPNEFQEDDKVALEKAVEETVRQSLDVIGIDPNLMTPAREEIRLSRLI